jgi:EAL domain-containing protein (putative c-di-GMP-specific phosphodiesterase class I)
MRVAQTAGRGRIIFFNENLMEQRQKNARIQQKLSDALANEEFRPFYQPKVDVNTGMIVGGEALCRWFHKDRIIPPAEFIPALEQTSDICKLDLYMLEHVCKELRAWLDGGEGRTLVPISINFSRKNIMNMDLPNTIERILDKYNIPHDAIEIELTETTNDVEFNDLRRTVTELYAKGISASVDDFGVGYSSLNLLKDIPWTTIKIDKTFVPDEEDGENSVKHKMFCGVLAMARNLGFDCVVEGVETREQLSKMKELGCEIVQGFYYDKPLPFEEFEASLAMKKYR